jgi:hypothetical protein
MFVLHRNISRCEPLFFMCDVVSAHQLSFSWDEQGAGAMYMDVFLFITGGNLYQVTYTTPRSLYEENLPVELSMIHSTALGESYDALRAQMLSVSQDTQAALNTLSSGIDIINNDLGSFAAKVGQESDQRHEQYLADIDQQKQDCKFASTAYNCP